MDMLQTSVHYDAEAISTYLISRKSRKVSSTSSAESNWVGYPVEDNTEGESHNSFVCKENFKILPETSNES